MKEILTDKYYVSPDMELVDAVKGLEVGFEDKDGKKVNS